MSKLAGMRRAASLFRRVAHSIGHVWTPVRRASAERQHGAGFTTGANALRRHLVASMSLMCAAATAAGAGRTPGTFAVSAAGEAQYSIPIFAPPGVNGLTPELSLTYGHRHRGTLAGVGWAVSGLSAIHRCEKTWAQNGTAAAPQNKLDDRYCLDGVQLRLYSGTYAASGSTYRTELETFSRITASGASGNGPASFKVELKSGLIHEYGINANSRILSMGQAEARAWTLSRISDRAGNSISFTWHNDTTNGAYRIDRVDYATNAIDFIWESKPAGEVRSGFVIGSQVREIHRLQAVEVSQAGSVLRRYELNYETPLSTTSRSRLAFILECTGAECRDPTRFDYQDGKTGLGAELDTGQAVPAGALPLDVNGDGLEDLVFVSNAAPGAGTWRVMLASATGYDAPIDSGVANNNYADAIPIDYNHDGLGDILVPYSGSTWYVLHGHSNGLISLTNTNAAVTATGRGQNARALDVNGDGRQDLVWADLAGGFAGGDAIRYRLRNPAGNGFSTTVSTLVAPQPPDSRILGGVFLEWAQKQPGRAPDFNGDGRADVVYRHESRTWQQELSSYAMTRTMRALCTGSGCNFSQNLPGGAGPPSFGDFNGDGLTDLFYYSGQTAGVGTASWWYAFSRGTSFAAPVAHANLGNFTLQWVVLDWDADGNDDVLAGYGTVGEWLLLRATGVGFGAWTSVGTTIPGFPPTAVTDIDGDGLHDFAYARGGSWRYRLHSGNVPDLLSRATDGYGNTIDLTYAPLTAAGVHTKTTGAAFPEQEWQGALTVVTEHRASDGVGGTYSTDHTYEGARRNLQGRGFEGFYRHSTVDDRNGLRRHAYFTRPFPYTGSPDLTEIRQASNALVASTDITWSVLTPTGGVETRTLPYPSRVTRRNYAVDTAFAGATLATGVTETTLDPATGSPTEIRVTTAEGPGANGIHGGKSWIERTVYSQLLSSTTSPDWCIGRPQRTQQINSHSTLPHGVQQTRTLATTWDTTLCRPSQRVVEPDSTQWKMQTDLDYDVFGNLETLTISGSQSPARVWRTSWGSDGRFPLSVRDPLNQTVQRTFDPRFGVLASETDPNGIQTTWLHDSFGRRTRETRADQTRTEWLYTECDSGCGQIRLRLVATWKDTTGTTLRNDSAEFDTHDRPTNSQTQILGGGYSRIERQYDDLGRVARESAPCVEGSCPWPRYWSVFTYDVIGRPTQITRPFSAGATQTTGIEYAGLRTIVTDPLSKISTHIKDGRGLLVRSIDDDAYHLSLEYDAFGNPIQVTDSGGRILRAATFNVRGLQESVDDADLGAWQYEYNAFGELESHTDANGKTISYAWDALGRPLTRSMPEGTGTITRSWTWGTSAAVKEIGRLKESQISGPGLSTYRESHSYDSKGRPAKTEFFQGASLLGAVNLSYSAATGLVDSLTYPESTGGYRLRLKYDYEQGLLRRVKDFNASSTVFWEANTMNAYGQILDETLGNGVRTIRGLEPRTGSLNAIMSGPASDPGGRQDLEYTWDLAGNLIARRDLKQSISETFDYDNLHRFTGVKRDGVEVASVNYAPNGNILSKSDVGNYTYDPARFHAVIAISGSPGRAYRYDANGNMIDRNGAELQWFADNRLKRIRKSPANASNSSEFQYGPDGQRWYHRYNAAGTIYTHVALGGVFEIVSRGAVDDYRHTIHANGVPVALYSRKSTGPNTLRYLLRDHLGSVDVITNAAGTVELKTSFDMWGERRDVDWDGSVTPGDVSALREITRRGYSDHEHLDSTGIIHMNGRVYGPEIARFLSADPFIDGAGVTQGWNRYSYVSNNPLSYTDPTGYAGVPRSPDAPPEGTPDDPFSCTGWGLSLLCDPFRYGDNARRGNQGAPTLTFEQVLALLERARLRLAGTEDFSPELGEAAGDDFGATPNRLSSVSGWWSAESTFVYCGWGCTKAWDGNGSHAFAPAANTASNGERMLNTFFAVAGVIPVGAPLLAPAKAAAPVAPKVIVTSGGVIRRFEQPAEQIYYRVYSQNTAGKWLTAVPPRSSAWAADALSLPPGNVATFLQEVRVPAGTLIERSRALQVPAWGRFRGGAEQFQLLEEIPLSSFGPGVQLP